MWNLLPFRLRGLMGGAKYRYAKKAKVSKILFPTPTHVEKETKWFVMKSRSTSGHLTEKLSTIILSRDASTKIVKWWAFIKSVKILSTLAYIREKLNTWVCPWSFYLYRKIDWSEVQVLRQLARAKIM